MLILIFISIGAVTAAVAEVVPGRVAGDESTGANCLRKALHGDHEGPFNIDTRLHFSMCSPGVIGTGVRSAAGMLAVVVRLLSRLL